MCLISFANAVKIWEISLKNADIEIDNKLVK